MSLDFDTSLALRKVCVCVCHLSSAALDSCKGVAYD